MQFILLLWFSHLVHTNSLCSRSIFALLHLLHLSLWCDHWLQVLHLRDLLLHGFLQVWQWILLDPAGSSPESSEMLDVEGSVLTSVCPALSQLIQLIHIHLCIDKASASFKLTHFRCHHSLQTEHPIELRKALLWQCGQGHFGPGFASMSPSLSRDCC